MKRGVIIATVVLLVAALGWWAMHADPPPSEEGPAIVEAPSAPREPDAEPVVARAPARPVPVTPAPLENPPTAAPVEARAQPGSVREKPVLRQERLRERFCEGEQWHETLLQSLTAAEKTLSAKHRIKPLAQLGPILTALREPSSAHEVCVQNVETIDVVLHAAE